MKRPEEKIGVYIDPEENAKLLAEIVLEGASQGRYKCGEVSYIRAPNLETRDYIEVYDREGRQIFIECPKDIF